MPLITVSYASSRQGPALKAEIAAAVSELTARILRKDPKVTAIIVKSVDPADWFAGGKSLAEQGSKLELGKFMFMSRGEEASGGRARPFGAVGSAWPPTLQESAPRNVR